MLSPLRPLDLTSGLEPKKQLLLSVTLNSSAIQNFVGIMPNHGSGELSSRQGFYAYEMMQSAAVFSLSGHITIRVIPIIKDLDRWGKTVRSCYKIII